MREAGLDFELYGASMAKVAETTRLDGTQIANAMKTVAARISRNQVEDEEVSSADRSKTAKAYASVGINVYNDDGSYRGLANILDELSVKWDTLTDAQRNYIAEQSGGVRNINIFNTMLDTWEDARQLAVEAAEDSNYYLTVQEKHMESMQAKINMLRATLQEFWYDLIETEVVNHGISLLTTIVNLLDKVVKGAKTVGSVFGELGGQIASIGATAGIVAGVAKAWDSFTKQNTVVDANGGFTTSRGGFAQVFKDAKAGLNNFGKTAKDVWQVFKDGANGGLDGTTGIIPGIKSVIAVLGKLKTALLGIGGALVVIGTSIALWDRLTDSTKETAEAVEKLNEAYNRAKNTLKTYKQNTDSIKQEFATLSKGVNTNTGENVSLTTDEYIRYQEITTQIAEMYPELVRSYDAQGNAILNLKGNVEELNKAYDDYRLKLAKEGLTGEDGTADNFATYIENFKNVNNQRSGRTKSWDTFWDFGTPDIGGAITASEVIDGLKSIQTMSYDEVVEWIKKNRNNNIGRWMADSENLGLNTKHKITNKNGEYIDTYYLTEEEWAETAKKIPGLIAEVDVKIQEATQNLKNGLQDYLTTLELEEAEFASMDSSVFQQVSNLISTMTTDQIKELTAKGIDIKTYVQDLVRNLNNNPDAQVHLKNILSLTGDEDIEELQKIFNDDLEKLAEAINEDPVQLKVQLGLEDEEEFLNKYEEVVNGIVEKYGGEQEKTWFDSIDEAKERQKELEKLFNEVNKLSNVDYSKRPVKTAEDMFSAGWNSEADKAALADNKTVTTYTSGYYATDFDKYLDANKEMYIEVTPILEDGTVLSPEELNDYVSDLFNQEDILAADKNGKNIVTAMFEAPSEDTLEDYYYITGEIKDEHAKILSIIEEYNKQQQLGAKNSKKIYRDAKKESNVRKEIEDFIKAQKINTADELVLLQRCVDTTDSWAQAMRKFSLQNVDLEANDEVIAILNENLDAIDETIDAIDEAAQASRQSTGLTKEQIDNVVEAFSDLKDEAGNALFDYDKLFESSAEGVRLNAQELDKLNAEYERAERAKYDDWLEDLETQYSNLCIAIGETTNATERSTLVNKRNGVLEQIKQVQELKSRYEGLTNAVTKYFRAKEGGEEGDTYMDIVGDMEGIQELYDHGLVGTEQWQAAVQMMTNEDLAGASIEKYMQVWDEKWSQFKSWMTEDATGVQNFLYDLMEFDPNMASVDENGFWTINADIEEIANGLGVSQAIIQEIFKRLKDYGFDVDFREETDHLKSLREEAEAARDALSEKYQLNLTAKGDDIYKELEKGKKLMEEIEKRAENLGIDPTTISTYNALSKETDYLLAQAGKTADAMNFELNYADNKNEIDGFISELRKIDEYKDIYINFENVNLGNVEGQIGIIKSELEKFRDPATGEIDFSAPGASELLNILIALNNKKIELTNSSAILKLDSNNFVEEQKEAIDLVQTLKSNMDKIAQMELQKSMGIEIDEGELAQLYTDVDNAIASINTDVGENGKNSIYVGLGLSGVTKENFQSKLDAIDATKLVNCDFQLSEEEKKELGYVEADATKVIDADTQLAKEKIAEIDELATKERTMTFSESGLTAIKNTFDGIQSKTVTITESRVVNTTYTTSNAPSSSAVGSGNRPQRADGTAHAGGTAYVGGNWGLKQNETALVGELGSELVVDPSTGTWNLVGQNGAEFRDLKKGQIVFNHRQTEEIFKNGYVTSNGGRGKALVEGTVGKLNSLFKVGSGSAYAIGVSGKFTTAGSLPGSNKFYNDATEWGNDDPANGDADEFAEVLDWIEILLDRIQRKIDDLDTLASSAFKSFAKRAGHLRDEYSLVTKEIEIQQAAYEKYMQRANSVNLSEEYKQKIRDGKLQIQDITNEDLYEKIQDYQEWLISSHIIYLIAGKS